MLLLSSFFLRRRRNNIKMVSSGFGGIAVWMGTNRLMESWKNGGKTQRNSTNRFCFWFWKKNQNTAYSGGSWPSVHFCFLWRTRIFRGCGVYVEVLLTSGSLLFCFRYSGVCLNTTRHRLFVWRCLYRQSKVTSLTVK